MPAPANYTEQSLAEFMLIELEGIGESLGWDTTSLRVEAAIHDVEVLLGVADVVDATNLTSLRLLARLCIWRAARSSLANRYHTAIAGETKDPQQQWDHANQMVIEYELQAASQGLGGAGTIMISEISRPDPYAVVTTDMLADW